MRIALRTSGGRGEYEIAGTQGTIRTHDVLNRHIVLEMLPKHRVYTGNYIRYAQGKPRIRLGDQKLNSHIYLILASLLLLPKPKRQISTTPAGKLEICRDKFSITSIVFDIIELKNDELVITPTQVILSNSSSNCMRLDVTERMYLIMSVWEAVTRKSTSTAYWFLKHKNAFDAANVCDILNACEQLLLCHSINQCDPLLQYEVNMTNPSHQNNCSWMGVHIVTKDEAKVLGEISLENFRELACNRIKTWRYLALRGAQGVKFSRDVKAAYNNTCLFTGIHLPKTELGPSGVDAAHILPWARYDINKISNGLCLSKLCHWAFDNRILVLDFNNRTNNYVLSISPIALQVEAKKQIDLTPFHSILGVIPNSLLPKEKANWPDLSFLRAYNASSDI